MSSVQKPLSTSNSLANAVARLGRRGVLRGALVVAAATALLALPASPDAAAKDAKHAVHPVSLHLESLSVGAGTEFRLLTVHPIFKPKPFTPPAATRLAQTAAPDLVGILRRNPAKPGRLTFQNLMGDLTLVLPGEIVRSDNADYAVTRHALVPVDETADLEVEKVSDVAPRDEERRERSIVEPLLQPALRFFAETGGEGKELSARRAEWMKLAGVSDGRESPADLAQADLLRERIGEYVERLTSLPRTPVAMELVGYAGVVDGHVAVIESFESADLFAPYWKRALTALAVQASLEEVEQGLLKEEIAESTAPDRFIAAVKEAQLVTFGVKPRVRRAEAVGEIYTFEKTDGVIGEAIVFDDRVLHRVTLVDPDRSEVDDGEDDFDPGVASRKARPTEEEKRLLERRKNRNPPIPIPGGGGGGE